jgi:hypothetical protein
MAILVSLMSLNVSIISFDVWGIDANRDDHDSSWLSEGGVITGGNNRQKARHLPVNIFTLQF